VAVAAFLEKVVVICTAGSRNKQDQRAGEADAQKRFHGKLSISEWFTGR
jgi:hypothetical protein